MNVDATNKEINRYFKLRTKTELINADIRFLKRCKQLKIFPNFIHRYFRDRTNDPVLKKVISQAKFRILHLEINNHYAKLERTKRELYALQLLLMKKSHKLFWERIYERSVQIVSYKSRQKRMTHINKLKRLELYQKRERKEYKQTKLEKNFVINRSSQVLSPDQVILLNKGLKYRPKPIEAPINEVIVAVESSIKGMEPEEKANLRGLVKKCLDRDDKPTKSKKDEWKTVKELKASDCVFLEPDKGKGVVVMDRIKYEEAAKEHLASTNYVAVNTKSRFPVDILQKKVKLELKKLKDEGLLSGFEVRNLSVANPVIPSFYCMPKTHKEGNKIRPVVSNINSPVSKICDFLINKFRSLHKPFSMSVKNSFEAADILMKETLTNEEFIVSFDVESLYPSVPVEDAFILYSEWIEQQDISDVDAKLLIRLMRIVLDQRWLEYQGKIYSQKEGLFIGNALSPILAEIFMGSIEKSIEDKSWFPRFWIRYVDDILAVVNRQSEEKILSELNILHANIKFTMEKEIEGKIPFLDLELSRQGHGISFNIYRKPTDAPLCIPRDSHHSWPHKMAAFESALYRMWRVPISNKNRSDELRYICDMALLNGYEEEMVHRLNRKHKLRHERQEFTKLRPITRCDKQQNKIQGKAKGNRNVIMPFHSSISTNIEKVMRTQGFNVCFQNRSNLKDLIGQVKKRKPIEEKSGIYNIQCDGCAGNYVGQTKRRIETRVKEHERALKNKQEEKSAIAAHCIEEGHQLKDYKLLKEVRNSYQLDAWESLYIAKGQNLVNTGEQPIRSKLFELATDKMQAHSRESKNFSVTIES